MKILYTIVIASLAASVIGCNSKESLESEIRSYIRQGDHFTFQGDHANAALIYRKGTLLGSPVCLRSEIFALVLASRGTNQADLQRAAELAETVRLNGNLELERRYQELLMRVRYNTNSVLPD
jgi:hypothetical protein